MLTPNYLESCADDILKLYAQLDESIARDIARRIVKTGEMTSSAKWQTLKLNESGLLYDDIINRISEITEKSNSELKKLFMDAGVESVTYDNTIYKSAGLNPLPLNLSPIAVKRLAAGLKKTGGLINNLTKTTALGAQKAYINACSLAELQVTSGAFDYNTAIRNAVNIAISDGATVTYPSGHTDKLDVAIRRSVITGVGQTTGEVSLGYAEDMGCDLMEITAHSGARPDHAKWQGKIVSLSGKKGYLSLSDIGYGTGAGFKGWNCRHDWYPFFEGISKPAYSKERSDELKSKSIEYEGKKYTENEAQQMQRAMERKIRSTRRELCGFDEAVKSSDDEILKALFKTDFDRKSILLKQQEAKYRDFCNKTSRYQDKARMQVRRFDRSVSQKAIHANKAVFKNAKSIFPKEWFTKDFDTFVKNVYNPNKDVLEKLSNLSYEEAKKVNPLYNDRVARSWYITQNKKIPGSLDTSKSYKEQAIEAFNKRNKNKSDTRDLMLSKEAKDKLDDDEPVGTFEKMVEHKILKGLSGDDIYMNIIKTSEKTRKSVNEKFGLG